MILLISLGSLILCVFSSFVLGNGEGVSELVERLDGREG